MELVLRESLRDRKIDLEDKKLINGLVQQFQIPRGEVEQRLAELYKSLPPVAETTTVSGSPAGLDRPQIFRQACAQAFADGLLSAEEERLLFLLKTTLGIDDQAYQSVIREFQEANRQTATDTGTPLDPARAPELLRTILANIEQVIVGKRDRLALIMTAALANSHVLLEDVPGTGKTMLARALAVSIDSVFKRVQFTPDLLPMDVTGSMIYNPQTTQFSFKKGPIFSNIFLADEINRATPRTQSSLLEVMEERQITCDGAVYPMPPLFFVLATQNPIDQHGTYPLPEAQLDRFMLKISMGYPAYEHELQMLSLHQERHPITRLHPVITLREFAFLQSLVRTRQKVSKEVKRYILDLLTLLRDHADLQLGPSPRAAIALQTACMAFAFLEGRDFVTPDDVKFLCPWVIAHRLALKPQALIKKVRDRDIVEQALQKIPVPTRSAG
jgi:MoxR-like ATPase